MNLLQDIITYVRRLIKSPSNATITDVLLIDYINRFWIMDVSARIQLFDLKTKYQLQTIPGVDQYNMPLYSTQVESNSTTQIPVNQTILPFPNGGEFYSADILANFRQANVTISLVPNTVEIWFDYGLGNQTLYQDNGAGVINFVSGVFGFASGTINYTTGILSIDFGIAGYPGVGVPVTANYTYNSISTSETIAMFPVYQNLFGPVYINGIEMPFYTQRQLFYAQWPNYNQTLIQAGIGNGTSGPYTLELPFLPNSPQQINYPNTSGIIRGHIDITGIMSTGVNQDPPIDLGSGTFIPTIPTTSVSSQVFFLTTAANGSQMVLQDSGILLNSNQNIGLLMIPGSAPYGNTVLPIGPGGTTPTYQATQNTINYITGIATNVYFPQAVPNGQPIQGQCVYYQLGIPRSVLFYNNTLTFRAPPDTQYLVEMDAYLTPAAFFNTSAAIPFGYMAEYIARGAARKILSDVGDWEQFNAYEPLFKEQETLVHIRSQRQWTTTRTPTIYSGQWFPGNFNQSSFGV